MWFSAICSLTLALELPATIALIAASRVET
jgi:hypothetical protein